MTNQALLRIIITIWLALLGVVISMGLLPPVGPGIKPAYAAGGNRATLTVTNVIRQGGVAETTYSADGDGHKFNNNGETWIRVYNAYTDTITATFVTPGTVDGLAVADLDVPVSAGAVRLIGNFPPGRFNQEDGTVYLNWNTAVTGSVASSVTVGAFRIQQ